MAKDPKTAERYAVDAMTLAIGALVMTRTDANGIGVDHVVEVLNIAIGKFDPRCDHEWVGAESPHGGHQGTCNKCHVVRYTQ